MTERLCENCGNRKIKDCLACETCSALTRMGWRPDVGEEVEIEAEGDALELAAVQQADDDMIANMEEEFREQVRDMLAAQGHVVEFEEKDDNEEQG